MIRILAIEDDLIYAESLKLIIEELNYILIDVVQDISEFQRLIKATIPDLLLIDIDLGVEIDGIELANLIGKFTNAPVIFVTSYKDKETILRASNSLPAAYIPKPYESSTLQAAIELALKHSINNNNSIGICKLENTLISSFFFVKINGVLEKVLVKNILYIEVKEKYCFIKTTQKTIEVKMRLKDLIELLPSNTFIQVHRSYVVMIEMIDNINANLENLRIDTDNIPIGKNYRKGLNAYINRIS